MNSHELTECLRLLNAADRILLDAGENVLAAYLSAVIEPLRSRNGAVMINDAIGTLSH